ncbi:hypothetical protein EON79_11415 [bacterium]|nr:MAG: hypothetical protein EON79_11415 [bacterium]
MTELPLLDLEPIDLTTTKGWFKAKLTFQATVVGLLVLLFWGVWASLSGYPSGRENTALRASNDRRVAEARAAAEEKAKRSDKESLKRTARAMAASLGPFQRLRVQASEITDRTLQDVVLRCVAIFDGPGKVVASSDLALLSRPLSTPTGLLIATSPVDTGMIITIGTSKSQ